MTPAGGVRLQSERNREDAIEMELDTTADPPQPLVTITRVRGSRVIQSDRSIKGSNPLVQLTEDDVIEMLLEELRPWLSLGRQASVFRSPASFAARRSSFAS